MFCHCSPDSVCDASEDVRIKNKAYERNGPMINEPDSEIVLSVHSKIGTQCSLGEAY